MNALQHHAFNQLLAAWRRREDARQHGSLRELADARVQLDSSRAAALGCSLRPVSAVLTR